MELQEELFRLKDEGYKSFHSRLMPTVPCEKIIGVRVPKLRKLAKEFAKKPEAECFLKQLPHTYYEEDNIHAFLIAGVKDFDDALYLTESFLPCIDNWATCDMMSVKVFKKNAELLLPHIEKWLESKHTYTVRYGIKAFMDMFLDERFDEKYLERVSQISSDEYYVNMMIAWYFATAIAKQLDATLPYIEGKRLSAWVHNKTIQKAIESYRIDEKTKDYLKTMKVRNV